MCLVAVSTTTCGTTAYCLLLATGMPHVFAKLVGQMHHHVTLLQLHALSHPLGMYAEVTLIKVVHVTAALLHVRKCMEWRCL